MVVSADGFVKVLRVEANSKLTIGFASVKQAVNPFGWLSFTNLALANDPCCSMLSSSVLMSSFKANGTRFAGWITGWTFGSSVIIWYWPSNFSIPVKQSWYRAMRSALSATGPVTVSMNSQLSEVILNASRDSRFIMAGRGASVTKNHVSLRVGW